MKIQFCSDLHLEFEENTAFLKNNPIKPSGDYLVLTGDISYLKRISKQDKWFFEWCSDNFKETWYVPGNHEFYDHSDISILEKPFIEKIKNNVSLVNNVVVPLEEYNLLFTPLFSHINDPNNMIIRYCMNDFHQIFFHKNRFTIENFNNLNRLNVDFLENVLSELQSPALIFTHHVPSRVCNCSEHNDSPLNEAFTNNLDDLILKHNEIIRYWIYGHSHRNVKETIKNTILMSNQLGYVWEDENLGFDPMLCVEIE
jgi:predicted phosphodiesterase